jgi:hypothetical protein
MRAKLAVSLLFCTFLTGCADWKQVTGTAAQMCKSILPVYPSRTDKLTKGTETQIAASNAANEEWCGYRPPIKEPRIASNDQPKDVKP